MGACSYTYRGGIRTRGAEQQSVKLDQNSHKTNLEGKLLNEQQIHEINTSRNKLFNDLERSIEGFDIDDRPKKLEWGVEQKYRNLLDGAESQSLNRLSYDTMKSMLDRAKYDLKFEQKTFVAANRRNGYMVGLNGRDQGGTRWQTGLETITNYQNVVGKINNAIKSKAERYVKRKDKASK